MRHRRTSSRNPIKLDSGEKVYTKKEVDKIIAKLRRSLEPGEVAEISVEDQGGVDSRTQNRSAQRESGRYGHYSSSGSQSPKPKSKGKKGKKGKKGNKAKIKDPDADVTYPQGKEIGNAVGGLNLFCPKSVRPKKKGEKFSNAQALTKMGLTKGGASAIIANLRKERSPGRKERIVRDAFKVLGITCKLDD